MNVRKTSEKAGKRKKNFSGKSHSIFPGGGNHNLKGESEAGN
jgi:hypothetical protein